MRARTFIDVSASMEAKRSGRALTTGTLIVWTRIRRSPAEVV
jgi:hypothetical protein